MLILDLRETHCRLCDTESNFLVNLVFLWNNNAQIFYMGQPGLETTSSVIKPLPRLVERGEGDVKIADVGMSRDHTEEFLQVYHARAVHVFKTHIRDERRDAWF